jgi:L-rhamnose-H+ transport protein
VGLLEGFSLTCLAGGVMGANLLPMKWIKIWRWENFWLIYSVVSLLVVPVVLAFVVVPKFGQVYGALSADAILTPFVFGSAWGIAQLGAGICVDRIGLALTASILNGFAAAAGTLLPVLLQHSGMLFQRSGLLILAGTGVMVAGVTLCGWAGRQREKIAGLSQSSSHGTYWLMIGFAVFSGILAALLNIALAYGGDIIQRARDQGAKPVWAVYAVWSLVLAGALIVNVGYSFYLLSRNKTWRNFGTDIAELRNPVLGGCMWMGEIAIYSSGTTFLGILGVSVGWALFQITMILGGNLAGLMTGEWRQVEARIHKVNLAGVVVLFLAMVLFGLANYSGA